MSLSDRLRVWPTLATLGAILLGVMPTLTCRAGMIETAQAKMAQVFCLRTTVNPSVVRYSTGVQVRAERLLTVWHEIQEARQIDAFTHDGLRSPTNLLHYDEELDLALLEIAPRAGKTVLNDEEPRPDDPVFIIGCPVGLRHFFRLGKISDSHEKPGGDTRLEMDLLIKEGDIGAPVFDREGRLVGLIGGNAGSDPQTAWAIPASTLGKFLLRSGFSADEIYALSYDAIETLILAGRRNMEPLLTARLKADPSDYRPYPLLALISESKQNYTIALDYLLKAAERAPRQRSIFQSLCRIYERLQAEAAAKRSCRYAETLTTD